MDLRAAIAGLRPKPIIWGVIAYLLTYSLFVGVLQIESLEKFGIYSFLVPFAFCAPPLVAGLTTGLLAANKFVLHGVFVVAMMIALSSFMWRGGGAILGQLFTFLIFVLPFFALGLFAGIRLKPRLGRLCEFGSQPSTGLDWGVVLLASAFPLFLATKVWFAEKSDSEKLCDGKGVVDEACARSKCEAEARIRIPTSGSGSADAKRGSTSSIAEHELVREAFPGSASDAKYWVMRGVKTFYVPESSSVEGHRVFICYVNENGSVWLKSSRSESERYPSRGTAFREAFESEWKR